MKNFSILRATEEIGLWSSTLRTIVRTLFGAKEEPEMRALLKLVERGAVCLDIGAGYGRYALKLSRLVGAGGKVYSFEPGTYSRRVLEAVRAFYCLRNVTVLPLALSDREGEAMLEIPIKKDSKFYRGFAHSLAHLSADDSSRSSALSVAMTTVDCFVRDKQLEKISFIKCDVEGAEPLVLQGALETLKRDRPAVLIEVYRAWLARCGKTVSDIAIFFESLDYKPHQINAGKLTAHESVEEDGNYFLLPSSHPLL